MTSATTSPKPKETGRRPRPGRERSFGTDYVDRGQDYYERLYQGRVVPKLIRRAQELGYTRTKTESPATPSPTSL